MLTIGNLRKNNTPKLIIGYLTVKIGSSSDTHTHIMMINPLLTSIPSLKASTFMINKIQYMDENPPVIEIARYAETDVYECYIRGFESRTVMRRTADDWINITQVFKLASFSKTKRTKVLDKESKEIQHEKVQGGYGRFQGTWIPLESAKDLVIKYAIEDAVVNSILNFVLDVNSPPPKRSKNSVLKKTSPGTKIISPSSYNKTPKRKNLATISSTASKRTKRASIINPSPLQNSVFQTPQQFQSVNSITQVNSTNTTISTTSLSLLDSNNKMIYDRNSINNSEDPKKNNYSAIQKPLQFFSAPTNSKIQVDDGSTKISNKKRKINQSIDETQYIITESLILENFDNMDESSITNLKPQTFKSVKNQTYWQNVQNFNPNSRVKIERNNNILNENIPQSGNFSNGSSIDVFSSNDAQSPLSTRQNTPFLKKQITIEEYKELMMQVLSSEDCSKKNYYLPPQLYDPPKNFDTNFQVDEQGHTLLHWAAAMANIQLVKLLLAFNVNVLQCNARGFNSISKLIFYNNCYKAGTFKEILSLLRICLITPDSNGRLPIHYLVELSVNKSKDPSIIEYYLDSIVENLKQEDQSLLMMCLNYQDNMGNTALHLAALNLNMGFYNKLMVLGCSSDVTNFSNETPATILTKFNMLQPAIASPNFSFSKSVKRTPSLTYFFDNNGTDMVRGMSLIQDQTHKQLLNMYQYLENGVMKTAESAKTEILGTPVVTGLKTIDAELDETTFNTTVDDSTTNDSLITSSVVKDLKGTPSHFLANSPVIYRKGHPISTLKKYPNETIPEDRLVVSELNQKKSAIDLLFELTELSSSLMNSMKSEDLNLHNEIETTRGRIQSTAKRIKSIEKQKELLLKQHNNNEGIKSVADMERKQAELKVTISLAKTQLINSIEKVQSTKLSKLIKEEEMKINDINETLSYEETLKLASELTELQLLRKSKVKQIVDTQSIMGASIKIHKYRRLIGIGNENLTVRLDETERDLLESS